MLQWLGENTATVNAIANVVMVAVWVIYLHVFWQSFRRQLRANLLINRGSGSGLMSRCLISNMSKEAVFIEGIILVLEQGEKRWCTTMSNIMGLTENNLSIGPSGDKLSEGPLAAGAYMDIGAFQSLLDEAREAVRRSEGSEDSPHFDAFEIWLVADYSTENRLIFVRRRFGFDDRGGGRWSLRPEKLKTEIVRTGRKRRRIEQMLEDQFDGFTG